MIIGYRSILLIASIEMSVCVYVSHVNEANNCNSMKLSVLLNII